MKLRSFLVTILFISSALVNAQQPLMPMPQKVSYGNGRFPLANASLLVPKSFSSEDQKAIDGFIVFVRQRTGIELSKRNTESATSQVVFKINDKGSWLPMPGEKTGRDSREAYQIKISSNQIVVTANASAGFFYGLQTLRQLIVADKKSSYVPEADIEDYPAFAYRGVMMDVAHGGLPTEEEIKKQIDFLSQWKMNQYYLYSEVSIEMKGYPLLNYNAQYSQEQIKRIVAYAKERHIDVIPFVELYGHLHELLRVEKYSDLAVGKYGHELDPRNPSVKILLRDWLKQYAALFPGPFFHIGFDETWETYRLSQTDSTVNTKQLYLDQLNFVTNTLEGYGKKVMLWTDITETYPEIISQFPKKVIPVVWEYSADTSEMNKWIRPVVKNNFSFFIQSAVDGWQHLYPDTKYTYDNIDLCLKSARDNNGGIGYITSVWADAVQTLQRNEWMFMAYGCIAAWQQQPVNRNDFISNYSWIEYPAIATDMNRAFDKLAESQSYFEKSLGGSRHTLTGMWGNPFSSSALKNTNNHIDDYKKARLAAELAEESLINALQFKTGDSNMIKTLLVNSRILHYAATRLLWAKNIVDRWDNYITAKGKKDSWVMYYDLDYSAHGLITDMQDYCTELKEQYRQAWLSENMPYRLGTMLGRFDAEYNFWRDLYLKVRNFEDHTNIDKQPKKFEELFGTE